MKLALHYPFQAVDWLMVRGSIPLQRRMTIVLLSLTGKRTFTILWRILPLEKRSLRMIKVIGRFTTGIKMIHKRIGKFWLAGLRQRLGLFRRTNPAMAQQQAESVLKTLKEEFERGTIQGYGRQMLHRHFRSELESSQ
jgi:hypothetical protein